MPFNFPSNPQTGDTSTQNGRDYVYAGSNVWQLVAAGGGGSLSGSVTVPGLGDPYFSSVSLLLHGDGTGSTFVDSSGTPKTITANGNATQSATQSKFGGKSAYFDGDGDYLSVETSADFAFAGDFTIEAWVYWTANAAGQHNTIMSKGNRETSSQWSWMIAAEGATDKLFLRASGQTIAMTSAAVPRNTWTHVAISRSGSTVRCFINGVLEGSGAFSDSLTNSEPVQIGRSPTSDYYSYFNGYIDELRVTKGVARWTASFAPQTAAFPNSADLTLPVTITGSGGGGSGLSWSSVPASATATGTAGQIAYDGSYFYVAVGSNQWERAALSSWTNWTPASLSGLSLWLDASDASSLYDATSGGSLATADGTVRRWQDKSGNARHATGSAGPTRKAASINSLDALLFNGSTNGLSVAGNLYGTSGYITMFAVVRKASVNTTAMIASQDNSNVSPRTYQFLRVGDTALQGIWFTSGPNTRVASATATVSANTTFLATLRIGSSGGAVSLNGAAGSVVSDTSNILTTSENTYIGSYAYTGNEWDGHICELVAYDTALSDANKATVESYLMTKWGIA